MRRARLRHRFVGMYWAGWIAALSIPMAVLASPASAHCWPDSSVPCPERIYSGDPLTLFSSGLAEFQKEWSAHQVQMRVTQGVFRIEELPLRGEHFVSREFNFKPNSVLEVRATIISADSSRVRLYVTGHPPSSAFCDFDLSTGKVTTTGAFGGARHRKPETQRLDDGATELICRIRLAPEQTKSNVRIQLLNDAGSGDYTGVPGTGVMVSKLAVTAF